MGGVDWYGQVASACDATRFARTHPWPEGYDEPVQQLVATRAYHRFAGNRLLLTWTTLAAPRKISLAISSNGVNWSRPAGQPTQTSIAQPDILALSHPPADGRTYSWVWTGANAQSTISMVYSNSISRSSQAVVFAESAYGAPAIGYPGPSGTYPGLDW